MTFNSETIQGEEFEINNIGFTAGQKFTTHKNILDVGDLASITLR